MQVVAEGIELPEQLAVLRELGCRYGQGFHYARALPARGGARGCLRESRDQRRRSSASAH